MDYNVEDEGVLGVYGLCVIYDEINFMDFSREMDGRLYYVWGWGVKRDLWGEFNGVGMIREF